MNESYKSRKRMKIMNLSNFKESFDKVVSAADVAYDPQAIENVSDKIQEFASNGEALGNKLVE